MNKRSNMRRLWNTYSTGTLLFAPFLILFIIFVVVPVFTAIVLSLFEYDMMSSPVFVGLQNFKQLFMEDEEFSIALKNTLIFAIIVGPLSFMFSFLMAWMINQLKFRNAFALAFYIPSITSSGGMATVWGLLFSSDRYGLINNVLFNLGIINTPIMFASDVRWIMPIIMFLYIWMGLGTGFLVFLAGLQSVSGELYEAAMVDGIKNRVQELWYITLPQMKPQLLFAAITSITSAFSVFDISVSFAGMPSANYAGHTLAIHLYDHAFIRFEMGYASAVAVILFSLIYLVGKISRKLFSSKDL